MAERIIEDLYGRGYFLARLTTDSVKTIESQVTVFATLAPGPQVKIRSVELAGLSRSDPVTVRKRLPMVAEQLLVPDIVDRLERAADQLGHLHFRPPIRVLMLQGYTEANLIVDFDEVRPVTVFGGGGYTPDDPAGLLWNLRVDLNNLFGGGRRASLFSARPDRNRTVLDVAYSQPLALLARDDIRFALATRDYRDDFYEFSTGGTFATRLADRLISSVSLGWKRVEPSGDLPGFSSYNAACGFSRDGAGYPAQRRSDYAVSTAVTFTHRRYSDDSLSLRPERTTFNDTRVNLSGTRLQYIVGPIVLRTSVAYSGLETAETAIPLSELYLVGGADGLRGYRSEQFAARRVAAATVEPRWLFASGFGFVFYEAAYLNLPRSAASSGDSDELYRGGFGFGMALNGAGRSVILSLAWGRDLPIDQPRLAVQLSAEI
jgi:outer membrane protein assembly factor BamA